MTSSLACCISALAHAPNAHRKNRNRSDDADDTCTRSGGSCTMKNQTRLMSKLRHKGTVFNVHDATAGADGGLEKICRNVGPRPVHFPDRWCNDAASISPHPADTETTTAALIEKQVSFQPRKSRRISPKKANVDGDNFTWVEILVVSNKKGSNKSRSLFYSLQTRHAFWDEPPTGASEVVFLGDLEKLNAVIARVEKQQREDPNALGVGSGGSARSISTDSTSLTSAPKVSWLSSHVGFLGESESENANTSTTCSSTIVQTRKMVLLFVINAILLAFLCLMGGVEISPDGLVSFMHVAFLFFQGMLLVWHLWPSP